MKIKTALAFDDNGEKQAVLVVKDLRSKVFGIAVHPGGNVVVCYETTNGTPGAAVIRALREAADSLERGTATVHDITPIIPQAEA